MPMPRWWGRVNKRVFNPGALRRGDWPVLEHVGRSTGVTHRTPLGAHRFDGGYVFVVVYGPDSDWVQNVMASRTAVLEVDGEETILTKPRLVPVDEAFAKLPDRTRRPPRMLGISSCLVMEVANQRAEAPAQLE